MQRRAWALRASTPIICSNKSPAIASDFRRCERDSDSGPQCAIVCALRALVGWLVAHACGAIFGARGPEKPSPSSNSTHFSCGFDCFNCHTHVCTCGMRVRAACVSARARACSKPNYTCSQSARALELTQILCNTRKCGVHVAHGRVCILFI